jgi:hypothetical protein
MGAMKSGAKAMKAMKVMKSIQKVPAPTAMKAMKAMKAVSAHSAEARKAAANQYEKLDIKKRTGDVELDQKIETFLKDEI